ncbi:TPA: hypothetical protein GRR62_24160 [Vibrio parahaemolyticus]|nr:hypothetical protein [Vibrio vulnificus]HAS6535953.1 hypothetical protein [Vibrio parahaemolyticus]HAS6555552.1 hypothetical protein [Vibrio parahaemolyticus]HAS6560488.1 hypothetical protein [Vibrio parahaemolyticus]
MYISCYYKLINTNHILTTRYNLSNVFQFAIVDK